MNFALLLNENYLVYLLLTGLLVIMYIYKDNGPTDNWIFINIAIILVAMSIADGVERWALLSPDRSNIRVAASVVHYLLQPLALYLELAVVMPQQENRNRALILVLRLMIVVNTFIYLLAPFAGELVFYYDADYAFHRGPLGYFVYIITFVYLTTLLYYSFVATKGDDKKKGIVLLFMGATGFLTGILEFLNIVTGFVDEAFALGLFLYYMYLIAVHESEMQAELARSELELSRSKVKLLRQQIRPHFVFNSLQIIKSLIRSDEDKAVECLEDFSDYLRANVDAIASDKLISFDQELAHIKAYVSLALADESKGVHVVYDIQEQDFNLPALTIEPLVENAIRHGLEKGGTVTLATHDEGPNVVITVADDGVGFKLKATDQEKKRMGTGLANVRARLATQVSGTLDIESSEGGTTVTVRIPKQRES